MNAIASALACGNPGCPCAATARKGTGLTHCPGHDDEHPSLSLYNGRSQVLWSCKAGCEHDRITEALRDRGLLHLVRDDKGRILGIHERKGRWLGPNAPKPADLLYGLEGLPQHPDAPVLMVEGEKARDALQRVLGTAAVVLGSVCGASSTPSPAVLQHFAGRRVFLWPDNDDAGRAHMERIAGRLAGSVPELRIVDWPDAPEKGDAFDYCSTHDRALLLALLKSAAPWTNKALDGPRITPAASAKSFPTLPQPQAFYGLLGRTSELIENYVESDRTSVLVQLLVAFGIACGTEPHFMVGATRSAPALYAGMVGRSSRGRKGTSWDPVEVLFRAADPNFTDRVFSGLGSGERLVHLVRDPDDDDPGEADRRLLLRESELARLLVVVNREGSTLSAYLREAFDGKPLRNEVKGKPARSSVHHIGMVGHCTADEVRAQLKEQQIRNGLANRILWIVSRRDRRLPDPPVFSCSDDPAVDRAASDLHDAITQARRIRRMVRSDAAQNIWEDWYTNLPDDEPGIVPAITERAETLVPRLSLIYALTDGSGTIEADHLNAALALWDYSVQCVEQIWGGTTGDVLADRVLEDLGYGPMLQGDIHREVFGGHIGAGRLEEIARMLERQGRITRDRVHDGSPGRPAVQWSLKR